MFVVMLLGALIVASFLTWIALVIVQKQQLLYRHIAPFMLIHAETLKQSRQDLEKIKTWADGRTFRELDGNVLAIVCLYGLVEGPHNNPDLIRIVEIISNYATLRQKAVFVRAVLRDVAATCPEGASQFIDLLERNNFKFGPTKRSRVELDIAQRLSREVDNPNQMNGKLRRLMRRRSLRKALVVAKASQKPL